MCMRQVIVVGYIAQLVEHHTQLHVRLTVGFNPDLVHCLISAHEAIGVGEETRCSPTPHGWLVVEVLGSIPSAAIVFRVSF